MLVYGHRGAAGEAPENTLGGFRHAWQRGARRFELDVHLAADEELVVIHDARVDRTTGERGAVSSFSSAALKRMDARRGAPPWPRREGIPRLREVLRALPRAESWQIEVKKGGSAQQMRVTAERLRALIAELRIAPKIIVTSADREFLGHARELMPRVTRGYVGIGHNSLAIASELGCSYLMLNLFACTPALRVQAWRKQIAVSVWTVNDPVSIRNLRRMRVHSIVSDYPSMALPLLAQIEGKAQTRSPPQPGKAR